jgi:hypothetical protein
MYHYQRFTGFGERFTPGYDVFTVRIISKKIKAIPDYGCRPE